MYPLVPAWSRCKLTFLFDLVVNNIVESVVAISRVVNRINNKTVQYFENIISN